MVMAICKGIVFLNYSELEAALEDGDIFGPVDVQMVKKPHILWDFGLGSSDLRNAAKIALQNDYDVAHVTGEDYARFFESKYQIKFYKFKL